MQGKQYLNSASPQEVNAFHDNDDVDGGPKSHHHTLGNGYGQASPGPHTHDGSDSKVLNDYMGRHNTQTGHVIVPEAIGELPVEFEWAFEDEPKISLTPQGFYIAFVTGLTPEGMIINVRRGLDAAIPPVIVEVDWIATDL